MNNPTLDNDTFFVCNCCEYFRSITAKNSKHSYCASCGNEMDCKCRKCGLEFKDPYLKFCERCGEKN